MNSVVSLEVIIEKGRDGQYKGSRKVGECRQVKLSRLKLAPDDQIEIKGKHYNLSRPMAKLFDFCIDDEFRTFWDERGQRDFGVHLGEEIFGNLLDDEKRLFDGATEARLGLVTDDSHIATLPWPAIFCGGHGRQIEKWTTFLQTGHGRSRALVELPGSPRLLVVTPEPKGSPTDSKAHVEELFEALALRDPSFASEARRRVVRRWEDVARPKGDFQPDVIYFYGHGNGSDANCRLIFESTNGAVEIPVSDFGKTLHRMRPLVAYVNCCRGMAGGPMGVGAQLAPFVPVVVTNRTIAIQAAARRQAVSFWTDLLLNGATPEEAIGAAYDLVEEADFTSKNPLWLTPVLYSNHGGWRSLPVEKGGSNILDPHWELKVDREDQFALVSKQCREMLQDEHPRGVSFVFCGGQESGLEQFHKRLKVELPGHLPADCGVFEKRLEWPPELSGNSMSGELHANSFVNMVKKAFGVRAIEDIPSRIRREAGAGGSKTLVYFRHEPLLNPQRLDRSALKAYIHWWDAMILPLLDKRQFSLLAISYQIKPEGAGNFLSILKNELDLEGQEFHASSCRVLQPFGFLDKNHLRQFLHRHRVTVPRERLGPTLEEIIKRTGGVYDKVVRELDILVRKGYPIALEAEREKQREKNDDLGGF